MATYILLFKKANVYMSQANSHHPLQLMIHVKDKIEQQHCSCIAR